MARIALLKIFTGLNLAVHQLAAEVRRAGHEALIVYFKDYVAVPLEEAGKYLVTDYAGVNFFSRGELWNWNCYKPITEKEYELLIGALREFKADLVGLSLTSGTLGVAEEVTARIATELGVPVVWGGPGPTLEPERCLEHADVVCVNEGEETLVELANRIDSGADLTEVVGTFARTKHGIVKNPARPLVELDSIAIPDFGSALVVHIGEDTLTRNFRPTNTMNQYVMMTSRGCPFSCSFCIESVYQDMFGKKNSLRRRSVDVVVEELVWAKENLDVTSVMFYDDVFTTHRKWLKEFSARYKAEVGLPFWCYTYPTTTRREDIALLADAGCVSMTMGIQSGSQRILNEHFNRPTPVKQAIAAAEIITSFGVECWIDIITKVDFETEEDCRATFRLLAALPPGAKTNGCGYMTIFPGYAYAKEVQETGVRPALSDEDYRYFHKLYLLASMDFPHATKLAISENPVYRRHPGLLDRYLFKQIDFYYIKSYGSKHRQDGYLDLSTAQATVPLEYRRRLAPLPPSSTSPSAEAEADTAMRELRGRLPVMQSA